MELIAAPVRHLTTRQVLDETEPVGPQKRGSKRFWTNREEAILRRDFPLHGLEYCIPQLPGRTPMAVYQHATTGMALKPPPRVPATPGSKRPWRVHHTSESLDRLILEVTCRQKKTRDELKKFAVRIGRPYWWVMRRARALAPNFAPRFKEPPWSSEEMEILENNGHKTDVVLVRMLAKKGYRRTETAVHVKIKRLHVDRSDPHHYTAHGLASLLGVDGKTVTSWIEKGWLHAKRRGTDRVAAQGGDQHWIHHSEVRRFIIEETARVDLRKVDKYWFIEFLTKREI